MRPSGSRRSGRSSVAELATGRAGSATRPLRGVTKSQPDTVSCDPNRAALIAITSLTSRSFAERAVRCPPASPSRPVPSLRPVFRPHARARDRRWMRRIRLAATAKNCARLIQLARAWSTRRSWAAVSTSQWLRHIVDTVVTGSVAVGIDTGGASVELTRVIAFDNASNFGGPGNSGGTPASGGPCPAGQPSAPKPASSWVPSQDCSGWVPPDHPGRRR